MFRSFSPFGQFQSLPGLTQWQLLNLAGSEFFQPCRRARSSCCGSSTTSTSTVVVVVNGTFVFEQAAPAASWTIDHPFVGQFPSVTVTDSAGNVVLADVQYVAGLDRVVINFAQPFAGTAYLNA